MTIDTFKSSPTPPTGNPLLAALWHDFHGNWEAAHDIAQDIYTRDGSWLHAYLHRKEGDLWNAGYWYRQAGKSVHTGTLEQEWEELAKTFLVNF